MTQPAALGGRPNTPPPGAETTERLVARFRGHGRHLFWCALVLIATAGATGYFLGGLPAPFEDWMLLAAAGVVVLLLVLLPFLTWASRSYAITTRRVIVRERWGARRREMSHTRGYTIAVRRGIIQRLWGAGTVTLANGIDDPLVLSNVPDVVLVHEALADQVEVGQILAHRDAQATAPPFA